MSQQEVLCELLRRGPASARALAEVLRSRPNTVACKLQRLKRWGLIEEVGQDPRTRASLYAPTEAGRSCRW
jgi:DNA-binding MarR family transcriptional regulator